MAHPESREELKPEPPRAGLCADCRHAREVPAARGSIFLKCERSVDDQRFPKYPSLPVIVCVGYESSESLGAVIEVESLR
jgi:hypothetical protein